MKAVITKDGLLERHYPGGRRVKVGCPYAQADECGDWCRLWRDPVPWTRREYIRDENGDITGEKLTKYWDLVDCKGYTYTYDELTDEREGVQKEDDQ